MVPELLMILYTPCSCPDTHCQKCLPLPIRLLHQICHPWPTRLQFLYHFLHTTGLPVTRCEFCLFKCQLETWTWICKIKAEEKLDLPALHDWQRGLCHHGQMGTSRGSAQEWPCEVLRLHREHTWWWDLPTSPFLWAGRHHKKVWWIHWWASRLDMPTHPKGTDQQWQWCCNRIQSSTQADSGDPRCQHRAAQTTSEGQPWQEGITPATDLNNILCCGVRSGCNMCGTCGICCTPCLPDTWYQATDFLHIVPQLHPSTPSW